jgi:hypothetical protein
LNAFLAACSMMSICGLVIEVVVVVIVVESEKV